MYVKRLLSINMATLAALGTFLLGMGERDYLLPLLVFLAACASVWFTDLTGRIRLSHQVSNLLVFGGVILAVYQFWVASGAIAMGNLLACIQIVLLFQEKDFRTWWHLAVLSFLQVAVAAAFNQDVVFGLLLIVYGFVALSALALLYLHHERIYFREAARVPGDSPAGWLDQDWRRVGKIAMATFVFGPASLFLRYRETPPARPTPEGPPEPDSGERRWALAGQSPSFNGTPPSITGRAGVGLELWGRLASMNVATLSLAALVFISIPRFQTPDWRYPGFGFNWAPSLGRATTVGYSDTVQLGTLALTAEDPQQVMQISFADNIARNPYPVLGDVYLRGNVLTDYSDEEWSQPEIANRGEMEFSDDHPPSDPSLVRQKIQIAPLNHEKLFCVWPVVRLDTKPELRIDSDNTRLYRPDSSTRRSSELAFEVGTTGFDRVGESISQSRVIPATDFRNLRRLLRLRDADFGPLIQQANQWIEESKKEGISESDAYGRALYLESKFRDPKRFHYTLQRPKPPTGMDAIVDFVKNNPSGNCEYFATALALMLRSAGIPARIAIGFRCDEYNSTGRYFQVRQLHAHTWVEAYLTPGQLPRETAQIARQEKWTGAWLRLDPTPASSRNAVQAGLAKTWLDRLDYVWETYIRGMNRDRQSQTVYHPLGAAIRALVNPNWWRQVYARLRSLPSQISQAWAEGRWFSWRGGLAAMAISLVLYGLYHLVRLAVRAVVRRVAGRRRARPGLRGANVEFYRRLEALLARHGLTRRASQTQREFALEAGRQLADTNGAASLAALPLQVANAFYTVRFGGTPLDKSERDAVELAMRRMEEVGS